MKIVEWRGGKKKEGRRRAPFMVFIRRILQPPPPKKKKKKKRYGSRRMQEEGEGRFLVSFEKEKLFRHCLWKKRLNVALRGGGGREKCRLLGNKRKAKPERRRGKKKKDPFSGRTLSFAPNSNERKGVGRMASTTARKGKNTKWRWWADQRGYYIPPR